MGHKFYEKSQSGRDQESLKQDLEENRTKLHEAMCEFLPSYCAGYHGGEPRYLPLKDELAKLVKQNQRLCEKIMMSQQEIEENAELRDMVERPRAHGFRTEGLIGEVSTDFAIKVRDYLVGLGYETKLNSDIEDVIQRRNAEHDASSPNPGRR